MDHDRILQVHHQKLEAHRKWIQQQQDALHSGGSQSQQQLPSVRGGGGLGTESYASSQQQVGPFYAAPAATARSQASGYQPTLPQQQTPGRADSGSVRRGPSQSAAGGNASMKSPDIYDEAYFTTVDGGSPIAVYMRGAQWARRRDQKLEEQRQQRELEESAVCTFRPCRGTSSSEDPQDHSGGADDGAGWGHAGVVDVAPGIAEHMERLEKARQRARERDERLNAFGTKWTPETTTPEPFVLGNRRAAQKKVIPALRQPIQAPNRPVIDNVAYRPFLSRPADASDQPGGSSSTSWESLLPPGAFSQRISFSSGTTHDAAHQSYASNEYGAAASREEERAAGAALRGGAVTRNTGGVVPPLQLRR